MFGPSSVTGASSVCDQVSGGTTPSGNGLGRHVGAGSRAGNAKGFTLIELVMALAIAGVLIGIGFSASAPARDAYAVRSGRTAFGALASRARALAVERGATHWLEVETRGDSAWIRTDSSVVEVLRLGEAHGLDVTGPDLQVCFKALGLADPTCGSLGRPESIAFQRGRRHALGVFLPLGQFVEGASGVASPP